MKHNLKAQLSYKTQNTTGEGITWIPEIDKLLWLDIEGKTLHIANEDLTFVELHHFSQMITTIIPDKSDIDSLIIAHQNEIIRYNIVDKTQTKLVDIPTDNDVLRTNDGKASPAGSIWLGVMHFSNHSETGFLYQIDKKFHVSKVLDQLCIPNGISWNDAGDTLFFVDSGKRTITSYEYCQETDSIGSIKSTINTPSEYGVPDGMTIDTQGNLWVAHWGGYGVYIWNPNTQKLIGKIEVPVPNIASCTLGGKNKDILYITTARAGLTDEELRRYPLSGSLFSCKVDARGAMNHYPF